MNQLFQFADPNTLYPPSHQCIGCKNILYMAYVCKECEIKYCVDHLPKTKKCDFCQGNFSFDKHLTKKINEKYNIKCSKCSEEMLLKDFDEHQKKGCKKECIQQCGERFNFDKEMKRHIDEECTNTIISCIGCKSKDKRGLIMIHQLICEDALRHKQLIQPLEKKIEEQSKEIELIKSDLLNQEKKNAFLEQQFKIIQSTTQHDSNSQERILLLEKNLAKIEVLNDFLLEKIFMKPNILFDETYGESRANIIQFIE